MRMTVLYRVHKDCEYVHEHLILIHPEIQKACYGGPKLQKWLKHHPLSSNILRSYLISKMPSYVAKNHHPSNISPDASELLQKRDECHPWSGKMRQTNT